MFLFCFVVQIVISESSAPSAGCKTVLQHVVTAGGEGIPLSNAPLPFENSAADEGTVIHCAACWLQTGTAGILPLGPRNPVLRHIDTDIIFTHILCMCSDTLTIFWKLGAEHCPKSPLYARVHGGAVCVGVCVCVCVLWYKVL